MMNNPAVNRSVQIKINGTALSDEILDHLHEVVVENSMFLPDMFELKLDDNDVSLTDGTTFALGAPVEIKFDKLGGMIPMTELAFKGEITSLEPIFDIAGSRVQLVVRGYDKSHRLYRGAKTLTFVDKTDSDIVKAIAGTVGLSTSEVETTTEVFKHVYQHALTDMEFLRQRAERIGFEVFVTEEKLYFRKPDPSGPPVTLTWGEDLQSFTPRVSVANQVEEVTVGGWDEKQKQRIEGSATTSKTNPTIGLGGWGGAKASSALASAKSISVSRWVQSVADAKSIAKGILDEINSAFVEAEGIALGNPEIKVGGLVDIKKVGTKFAGKYKVTSVQHIYIAGDYKTAFSVSGPKPNMLTSAMQNGETHQRIYGVVPAIVTGNKVDDKYIDAGAVKVKYPWLDDKLESFWARLMIPGGSKERGIYFMPEVNDEVLVAFENGDFNRPYVIGGLFNGKDTPIAKVDGKIVKDGKVRERVIKTRTGHTIRFVDDDSSDDYIEVITAKQDIQIKMDTKNKTLSLINTESDGKIEIKVESGKLLLQAKEIEVKSTMDTKMSAKNLQIETQMDFKVKATGSAKIEATANLDLKATAQATLEGTGPTTVKSAAILTVQGSLVKIN